MSTHPNRREFLSTSAGFLSSGWLWLQLPALTSLSACAMDAARSGEPFTTLTPEEGATMRALAARIIPSDDGTPGAEEAGAAWFVDGAVGGPMAPLLEPVRAGLADVDRRAREAHDVAFADLTAAQQDEIVGAFAAENELFGLLQFLTVAGVFSNPEHGGNRDGVGFELIRMERAPSWQPPFGWYDEQYVRNGGVA